MTSRQHLEHELESIGKKSGWITFIVWAVAALVMIFGIPIVYELLTAHDVPAGIAWLLSIASDGALIVGLVATPVLATYSVPSGWIGTLRWIAGFITWGLQTLGPFTVKDGPDWIGVLTHSAGPVLLFFVVEGASYFQRRMGEVITGKRRELEALEKADRDERASRADVEARLGTTLAELNAARAETRELTERLNATVEHADTDKVTATLTVERLEAELGEERRARAADVERLTVAAGEAIRDLKAKHKVALAEASTVNLKNYRDKHPDRAGQPLAGKPAMSDEAAVQAMLDAHDDPEFEWSKNAVRTLTGVGFARAERLIELWFTAATDKADGGKAVNQ